MEDEKEASALVGATGAMSLGAGGHRDIQDRLKLQQDASFLKLLTKLGGGGCFASAQTRPSADATERVLFSDHVTKINRRGKAQQRILCVTSRAIYNLKNPSRCQRRIKLELVKAVSFSRQKADEFAIHVPTEYDYFYKHADRELIADFLQQGAASCGNHDVTRGMTKSVKDFLVTKPNASIMDRQQRLARYRELINTEDDDEEDDVHDAQSYTHLHGKEHVKVEDFQMLSVLGRGAFGKVMEVSHKKTGNKYAMKILRIADIIKKKQVDHTKTEREMLEAMQHPFLMGLKFAFKDKKKIYFVLDYYPGGELFYHLQTRRSFPEATSRMWVAEIALALGHLHTKGYIYRDLKPENIVLGLDGHVCLTDFGLAKSVSEKELTYSFVGTPEYLAPEIIQSKGHNKNVDWWSLGILLFELCNGLPPFYSKNAREMYQKILNSPIKFRKGPFSREYKEIVLRLLERDQAKRLGSQNDIDEVMAHPFFSALDRDVLLRKEIQSQYKPKQGQKHVAKEFKMEKPILSKAPTPNLAGEDTSAFLGFTFVARGEMVGD